MLWSVGFALLCTMWLLLMGDAGVAERRPPHTPVQTVLVVSNGIAAYGLVLSILGAVGAILGLLFGRQYQEYLRRDQEYRRSTERLPHLLGVAYAVWFMAFLVVLATPVMNYVQGACSSAWECSNAISNGWFLTFVILASVLDWIRERVMARRRSLPSSSS